MADKSLKIVGVTVSITWLMFTALAVFVKALGTLLNSWFTNNALIIVIISGVILLVGIITGTIALGAMTKKGKGLF